MFSNVISLVLSDSDSDSENVSLIRRLVSDGQKTCISKGTSLIGRLYTTRIYHASDDGGTIMLYQDPV